MYKKSVDTKRKLIFCSIAILLVIALACVSAAIALLQSPNFATAIGELSNAQDINSAIENAPADYVSEKVIVVSGDVQMNGAQGYDVKSGQSVRFVAYDSDAKLTFSSPLTIQAEARVTFDIETRFTGNGNLTVNGTLTINHRLYNAATITIGNKVNPEAEVASEGILVDGSLNNDAAQGGSIVVNDGASLTTVASTQSTYKTETGDADTFSNRDGGTLMLKNGADSLGLTVNGTLKNNGSVIYESGATMPTVSGNAAVAATFVDVTADDYDAASIKEVTDTAVLYAAGNEPTLDIGTEYIRLKNVNLLSFGKITYKICDDYGGTNWLCLLQYNVSLGGGVVDGVEFTQGANELIFDGGAIWEKGAAPAYGNINLGTTIFYDENNEPYVYTNSGKSATYPFFYLYAGAVFSMYGGTKITNFEMSGGANKGTVMVVSESEMRMYGGEISHCAVTNSAEGGTGAGIYCNGGKVKIYGGAVTHNAAATSANAAGTDTRGSADGAGIAIDPKTSGAAKSETNSGYFYMYGGEVSYNHGSAEYKAQGADGGGIMLRYSYGFMYGGEIRGNYTGGTGGGLCAWDSDFTMYGGTVAANHAVFGGGLGVVCDGTGGIAYINIYGGSVQDNNAFQNKTPELASYGGYGGGICVGSNSYPANALITVTTGVTISGNKSYYGGGLAVYTNSNGNQLKMEGGLISGNAAYELPSAQASSYCATYENPVSANGGGVYVTCSDTPQRSMLVLSGDASIDSSNSVSFNLLNSATPSTTVAPIDVTGELTGSGLGALVYIDKNDSKWNNKPIISNGSNATAKKHLNKFVLDGSNSAFTVSGTSKNITMGSATEIAQIGATKYNSLKEAVEAAADGATIEILQSATISDGQITIDKKLTIRPASGLDVTLVIASDAEFNSTDHGLFNVIKNGSLTLNGTNGDGSRLTIDGNGTGRKLNDPNCQSISLVYIDGGSYTQKGDLYLRNNITENAGSAVNMSAEGGEFTMNGGAIENNTTGHVNGGAVFVGAGAFTWTGGAIQNNVSSAASTVADYGVYLSSNTSSLSLDNKVTLSNNAIYLGAAKIYVESNFDFDGTIPVVLPDASALQAGTTVIYGKKDVHTKFEVHNASADNVMTLGSVTLDEGDYRNNIVVHKTLTYLLDSRYAFDESGNLVSVDDVITSNQLASVIAGFRDSASGVSNVKTRDNGKVLAIAVSSTGEVPALNKNGASISDVYTRIGYVLTAWTDNKSNGVTVNWNNALTYAESTTNITLYPRWQQNSYVLSFDKNAPSGQNTNASVFGDDVNLDAFTYEEVGAGINLPSNNWYVIGYVFGGWKETANAESTLFAKADTIKSGDLDKFTPSTDNRGQYSLTVYANWIPLFAGGIGTELAPFVIETAEQLQRLQQTVNGDEVTVGENTYYNAHDEANNLTNVPYNYSGMYVALGADIAVAHTGVIGNDSSTPFAGTFNGNFYAVTLGGNALFGYLNTAKISGIVLNGSVASATTDYVGALAEVAISAEISEVANEANVNVLGKTVGGIVGQASGVQLMRSFNHGAVAGDIAGGIVGSVVGSENTFRNVYNTGAISGASLVGGIAGSATNVLIESVFNGGDVNGATMGAIVGSIGSGVTFASSYFNTDREYSTNPVTATSSGNVANVVALPSSQMAVNTDGDAPLGMTSFSGSDRWTFQTIEGGYFYPQLKVFADNERTQALSQTSAQLTVKQDETEEPLTPEHTFKVTYVLGGGAFKFDGSNGTDYYFNDSPDVFYIKEGDNYYTVIVFSTDNAKVVEPNAPSRTGYDFAGWFVDERLTSQYDFDSGVSATDITLYAKWDAIEYRIAYDLNGGAAVGQQQSSFVKLGSSEVALDLGQMTDADVGFYTQRLGYFFSHWTYAYTDGNNAKTCNVAKVQLLLSEDGEPIAVLTDTTANTAVSIKLADLISNELRFSAVWEVRTYNISYAFVDENGNAIDNVTSGNPTSYTIEQAVSFTNPTKAGYAFTNWHIDSADGEIVHNIPKGSTGNRTIYGVFNANTYRITFNTGEGDLDIDALSNPSLFTKDTSSGYYMANVTFNVAPNTTFGTESGVVAAREGYTFKHWSRVRDVALDEFKFDFDNPYNVADNITLYAIFEVSTFTVTVDIDYRISSNSDDEISNKNDRYFSVSEVEALNIKAVNRHENVTITIGAYIDDEHTKCSSYTISGIAYGKSAYAYLVASYGEGTFTGWDNLEAVVETKADAIVSASFILPVKITFTNTYIDENRVKNLDIIVGQTIPDDEIAKLQPSVVGYKFDCWVDIDGNKVEVVGAKFDKATLLFAKYTPADVTVNFVVFDPFKPENGDAPDGFTLNAPTSVKVPYDELFDDSLPTLVRTGYIFDGWYSADGKLVTSNSAVRAFVTLDEEGHYSVTLYANEWTPETYTITLSPGVGIAANFANGVSSTITYTYAQTYGEGVTVPCDGNNTIIRQGYTLTGWYYNGSLLTIDGNQAAIPVGTHGNVTLTAGWERRLLTVMFSSGEGYFEVPANIPQGAKYYSVSGDVETEVTTAGEQAQLYKISVQYGSGAVAPLRPFRTGYAFSVWDTSYAEITEDVTVTATYAIQSYTLYLSAGGGAFGNGSELVTMQGVQFDSEVSYAALQNPSRVGHTFIGWKGSEFELNATNPTINMLARDVTLVAQWEVEKYTISFDLSDVTDVIGDAAKFFENNYNIITTELTVNDNVAIWTVEYGTDLTRLNRTFKPAENQTLVWMSDGSICMFALATKNVDVTATLITTSSSSDVVAVTFDYCAGDDPYIYPYGKDMSIVFPQPVRNGYTFSGWYEDSSYTQAADLNATATEDVTYYAKWEAVTYNITYVNGGDLAKTPYKINYTEAELNLPVPTRSGYAFGGWFTDSSLDEEFEFESGKTYGNLTLFAKWEVKHYSITVNNVTSNNGGEPETLTFNLVYGGDFAALAKIWSRDYHKVTVKFDGGEVEFNLPSGSALSALDEIYKDGDESLFVLNEDGVYAATLTASYSAVEYAINFYNVSNTIYEHMYYDFADSQTVFAAAQPSDIPAGNTFVSWGVALSGGSLQAVSSYKIELQGSEFMIKFVDEGGNVVTMQDMGTVVELYPMLSVTTYDVIFNALSDIESGDIDGAMKPQQFVYNVPQALSVNEFVRVGYTFNGWKDENGTTYSNGQVLTLTGEKTAIVLTAQWTPNVYQVYYNAAGGTLTAGNVVSASFNTSVTLPSPIRAGYTFDGWKINNQDELINGGAVLTIDASVVPTSGNLITLTAQWTAATYTITFDGKGVNVDPATLAYTVETVALTLPEPSRDNYTFGGWYLDENYSSAFNYAKGETVGSFTLYAKWTAKEYSITFDANGGAVTPATLAYTVETATLTLPTPVRTGYTFGGWYTDDTCSNEFDYTQGTTVNSFTLYAKWNAVEYSITLNANGGTVTIDNPLTYTVETAALTLPTPVRAGYTLAGWALNGEDLGKSGDNYVLLEGTIGNITLVAKWTAITYTVTFNEGEVSEITLDFDGQSVANLSTLSKDGYVFNGWKITGSNSVYTGSISLVQLLNVNSQPTDNTFALTSDYSVTSYTITYVLNGGTNEASNPSAYNVTTADITLKAPARTGYVFGGWYANAQLSGEATAVIAQGSTGNMTLYAKWTAVTYTVTLYANGGELTNTTKTITYGQPYGALPLPIRAGYAFAGWFTKDGAQDDWGTEVTVDTVVSETSARELYAKWTAVSYGITYILNGGALGEGIVNVAAYNVDGLMLELNNPSRVGYDFAGWTLNGDELSKSDNKYVIPAGTTGNITLVATWTAKIYKVTVSAGENAKFKDLPDTYKVENDAIVLEGQLHNSDIYATLYNIRGYLKHDNDYNFLFWNDLDSGEPITSFTLTGELNVVANWSATEVSLTLIRLDGSSELIILNKGTEPEADKLTPSVNGGYSSIYWTQYDSATEEWISWSQQAISESSVLREEGKAKDDIAVTFDSNGGALAEGAVGTATVTYGQPYGALPTPTRAGYTFIGWFTSAVDGAQVTAETLVSVADDHTIYAQWTIDTYSITYMLDGGALDAGIENVATYNVEKLSLALNEPTRTGYTFAGWILNGEDLVKSGDNYVLATGTVGNITLVAKWTAKTYAVTLNANDDLTEETTTTVTYAQPYGDLPALTRLGYTFIGWFTAETDGDQITAETTVAITANQTLYAHWTAKTYSVAFNLNGGSGNAATTSYIYGDDTEVAIPEITRTGYAFDGWFLDGSFTGNAIEVDENKAMLSDIVGDGNGSLLTLHAKWTAIEYKVVIDGIVKHDKLTLDSASTTIDLTLAVSSGRTMNGWKLSENGEIVISASIESIKLLDLVNIAISNNVTGNEINLYSDITANTYLVTLNANGGALTEANTLTVTYGQPYGALPAPIRAGYTFDGWFTEAQSGTQVTAETTVEITSSQTLYAHWTVKTYTVTLNANGGALSGANTVTVTYGQPYGVLPAPTRDGYDFAGWFTTESYQVTADTVVTITADQTLSAHWTIVTYNIVYALDGGTNNASNPSTFTVETETITLADPTRAGYTFDGWYANAQFGGEAVTAIVKGSIGNKTLYAKWTSVKYTIVFMNGDNEHEKYENVALDDVNGGTITLPAPQSSNNLTYGGWYVQNNISLTYKGTVRLASVLQYANEDKVITFYVVWSDPVSVISYVLNGGVNNAGNPNSYKQGDTFVLLAPTRADYDFVRWYRMTEDGNATVEEIDSSTVGDVTLYAEWTVKSYAVTVTIDGWTYGEAANAPVAAAKLNDTEVTVSAGIFVYEYSADEELWTTSAPTNAGGYFVRAYYLYAGGEHSDFSTPVSFAIGKKAVTLSKLTATGTYGDALVFNANATVAYDGLVAGDNASAITLTQVELALADSSAKITVGETYNLNVTINSFESNNYTVTVGEQGAFTYEFSKRDVMVTIGHAETPYKVAVNLSSIASLVTVSGLANGDSIADLGVTLSCIIDNGGNVGDYPIKGEANSANYNVTFVDGVCTVTQLDLTLVINNDVGGVYNDKITPAKVVDITCGDTRITAEILAEIKDELLGENYKFTFVYSGASFDGVVYGKPNEAPANAGIYYATTAYTATNYRFSGVSQQFRIDRAENNVTDVTIKGWMYGMYDSTVNAPNATAVYGDVVYTYSATQNGEYTAFIPQNVGVYYVRAEVAESANYKAVTSKPTMFKVSKAIVNAPQAVIVLVGDNRNVEYTGRELRLEISGFDSTLMLVSYDGQTIVDGNNVAVVAVNAGTYTIKIRIVDVNNYAWAEGTETDEDGSVTLVWTVAKKKVAAPSGNNVTIDVSGEYETYLPEGFDADIMDIVGNCEAFGGKYTATITLKDSANYEWDDTQLGESIKIDWQMNGISKAFVIVVSVLGGLAVIGCGFIGGQFIAKARKKRLQEQEMDKNSSDEPEQQDDQE